jgi:PTH1 family peptidyl-tRNA hydrolase
MVLDVLAERLGGRFKTHKSGADVVEGRLAGARAVLAKPRSYMNLSGPPVAKLARFFKINPADIIVVHDELDLPPATIRVKLGGGEGGHNGLRSITASLGTKDYLRVRFGIGRPPGRMDPADYVLKDFSAAERKDLPLELDRAADAVEQLISDGLLVTQNQLH